MNGGSDVSLFSEIVIASLLIAGALITLIGTVGLFRLQSFYERVHAPTLGTTLGATCVALASIIYFSAIGGRTAVHELLIIVFVIVTTPISLMVLVRAAVLRDRSETERATEKAENKGR